MYFELSITQSESQVRLTRTSSKLIVPKIQTFNLYLDQYVRLGRISKSNEKLNIIFSYHAKLHYFFIVTCSMLNLQNFNYDFLQVQTLHLNMTIVFYWYLDYRILNCNIYYHYSQKNLQ